MKKKWILGILAILLIIVLIIIFYNKPIKNELENEYDVSKEQPITFISGWIKNLEECQGYSKFPSREEALEAGYSYECVYASTDISDFNLAKLKSLENIKGIKLDDESAENYNFTECNLIWKFNYAWVGARVYHTVMIIYDCENKFYIVLNSYPGNPRYTIYQINPTEDIINKLTETT